VVCGRDGLRDGEVSRPGEPSGWTSALSCCKCDSSAPATTPSAARASPGRV